MKILEQGQIKQKIKRLAVEIVEQNFGISEIIFAGINNNGLGFAKLLIKEVKKLTGSTITLCQITLNPAKPVAEEAEVSLSSSELKNKTVIIVDDVANTGRTLFYAFKPFMGILVKKMQVAVLVDRKHKSFPIQVDYVGLSLATTLNDNIDVKIIGVDELEVCLD
ncbi:MAG: phosphoribosyltransferase family protein [Saprospiraceae bacterium]|nr:phosphoribosyltransferase family protein [Saprospiraceae bacterium]